MLLSLATYNYIYTSEREKMILTPDLVLPDVSQAYTVSKEPKRVGIRKAVCKVSFAANA